MFLKISSSKNYRYVSLVKSYREGGKNKHKVVAKLGRLDELQNNPEFKKPLTQLIKLVDAQTIVADPEEIEEKERLSWGYVAWEKLWESYKISEVFERIFEQRRIKFDLAHTVFGMVIDRLLHPRSKLAFYENQQQYLALAPIELQHLYRALSLLSEKKEEIEDHLFEKRKDLFNFVVDVVFYDVTTFHFESILPDDFKNFGYSKDAKFNEVQVVLGLLLDREGMPVGYNLFPGNTFEDSTLIEALKKLKKRFNLGRIIIVADKGINSKINLKAIKDHGYDYVVGMRLRGAAAQLQEEVLDKDSYLSIKVGSEGEEMRYKAIPDHTNVVKEKIDGKWRTVARLDERLVCLWSEKRAKKDRADRERLIEKAVNMIEKKTPVSSKKGAKRYIKTEGALKPAGLDAEKIEEDKKFDGFYVLQTSDKIQSPQDIAAAYHDLWKIEQAFRIFKSTMKTRPVWHWTPPRIKGHFVMCYMAFVLERSLQIKLKSIGLEYSSEKIREALNSLQVSRIEIAGEPYYLKSASQPLANKILRTLRIRPMKNLTRAEEMEGRR